MRTEYVIESVGHYGEGPGYLTEQDGWTPDPALAERFESQEQGRERLRGREDLVLDNQVLVAPAPVQVLPHATQQRLTDHGKRQARAYSDGQRHEREAPRPKRRRLPAHVRKWLRTVSLGELREALHETRGVVREGVAS